jgi:DNA-binding MarR family transcriptional regulator
MMSNASDFGTQLMTYYTIVNYIRAHGFPPTVEELAKQRHLTTNAIYEHLRQLEARGYITRKRGWRNIQLPKRGYVV